MKVVKLSILTGQLKNINMTNIFHSGTSVKECHIYLFRLGLYLSMFALNEDTCEVFLY